MRPSTGSSCAVNETRPEYHFHDDFSLTPAYVLGYAFHALGKVGQNTPAHGRRGAVAQLTELLATMTGLGLEASLAAAEPLRIEKESLARSPHSHRIGATSAARVLAGLATVEEAVRSELRTRGSDLQPLSPASRSLLVLLGQAALARCPESLRADLTEACRAVDAHLYTAAVFHCYRVWEQLPGPTMPASDAAESLVADPRLNPGLHCTRADAAGLLAAIRVRLEG